MVIEKRVSLKELSGIGNVIGFDKFKLEKAVDAVVSEIKEVICISGRDGTWMLLGKKYNDEEYTALQVASSNDIYKEIRRDLNLMLPVDEERDSRFFKSLFGGEVCKIIDGLDSLGQRYRHMYDNYDEFCVVIVDLDAIKDNEGFETKQYAEVKFACAYKAKYWNPNNFNQERKILEKHEEWVTG